jgi:hypothetical protein
VVKVDFLFYQEKYAGTIIPDATSLKQPLLKANLYLSQMLCEDGEGSAEELVKLCLCEVAELLYQDSIIRQGYGGRQAQSENTDGYSVSYVSDESSLETKIYCVIDRYLSHTGLLYMGVE